MLADLLGWVFVQAGVHSVSVLLRVEDVGTFLQSEVSGSFSETEEFLRFNFVPDLNEVFHK